MDSSHIVPLLRELGCPASEIRPEASLRNLASKCHVSPELHYWTGKKALLQLPGSVAIFYPIFTFSSSLGTIIVKASSLPGSFPRVVHFRLPIESDSLCRSCCIAPTSGTWSPKPA